MNACITEKLVEQWCREIGLNSEGRHTVKMIFKNGPVREVKGSRSVTGRYSSRITGEKIPFESGGPELGFLEQAHDPLAGTRLIVAQPDRLRLTVKIAGGAKEHTYDYTPDYLIVNKRWAGYIECKHEEEIEHVIDPENPKCKPEFYVKVNGRWTCPAAEKAAKAKGLDHQMFVFTKEQAQYSANLEFLADYFDEPNGNYLNDVAKQIRAWVKETPGILLSELRDRLPEEERDTLFFMVARREVFADIENVPLAPNFRAPLFRNQGSARAAAAFSSAVAQPDELPPDFEVRPGTEFVIGEKPGKIMAVAGNLVTIQTGDDHIEMLVGDLERRLKSKNITLLCNAGAPSSEIRVEAIKAYGTVDPDEWAGIFRKKNQIEPYLNALTARARRALPKIGRSTYRYLKEYREAEIKYGVGFGVLGLRNKERPGNPGPKLDKRVIAIIDDVIDNVYQTKTAPTKELAWGECMRRCRALRRPRAELPSRDAFLRRFKTRNAETMTRAREGDRAAYALSAALWRDEWDDISVDGEHAWSVAHIDHTQIDCETTPLPDGMNLGRPWLTLMVSPRYGRILAAVQSFEPPSYRSCMAVMRECVRKHGRLPRIVVTDNGREFKGNYFDALLHRFTITQKFRPTHKGRFGKVLERMNLKITTRLFHNLPGNTKLTKNPRNLSSTHNPRKLAVLSLPDLAELVRDFCYEFIDTTPHPITGLSPRAAFNRDMSRGGPRSHKIILDNDDFRVLTMPTTKTGRARVCNRQGAIINHIPYWCDEIRDARHHGKKFPVKYNPEDYSEAWIKIGDDWFRCSCKQLAYCFKGLEEKEIRIATMEMLAAAKTIKEKRRAITAEKLADFFRKNWQRPDVQAARVRAEHNKAARPGGPKNGPHAKGRKKIKSASAQRPSRGKPPATVSALARLPKSAKRRSGQGFGGPAS